VNAETLEGCLAKVDRADALLKELADKWVAFLETDPYSHWIDDRTQPGWQRVYCDFSQPPWPYFGVIAGEIAHDLRSALDHFAWREAVEASGHVKAVKHERDITFPIRRSASSFKHAKVLGLVSKDAAALMERCQPYKRGKGIGPKSLGLLHWFNRLDKHHAIHVGAAASPRRLAPRTFLDFDALWLRECVPCLRPGRELKGRAEVMRLRFDARAPDTQVHVKRAPQLNISFGEVPRQLRGIGMAETAKYVRLVVNDFGKLLPR
jgi:hypothetical protein